MNQRRVRLRVIWPQPVPSDHLGQPTEFGMQKGRDVLLPGVTRPDGSTAYETEVSPYRDAKGRLRFRGECVQGPPDEPFLYLSWRGMSGGGWIGRGKIFLQPLDESFLTDIGESTVLETTLKRLGHR